MGNSTHTPGIGVAALDTLAINFLDVDYMVDSVLVIKSKADNIPARKDEIRAAYDAVIAAHQASTVGTKKPLPSPTVRSGFFHCHSIFFLQIIFFLAGNTPLTGKRESNK